MQCNNHNYKLTLRVTQIRPQPRRCIVWPLVRSQQLTSNDTNATKHATEPPNHRATVGQNSQQAEPPSALSHSLCLNRPHCCKWTATLMTPTMDAKLMLKLKLKLFRWEKQLRFIWSKLFSQLAFHWFLCRTSLSSSRERQLKRAGEWSLMNFVIATHLHF